MIFKINGADFGVDEETLEISFKNLTPNSGLLSVRAQGREEQFAVLSETDDWSWALHPPQFYASEVTIATDITTKFDEKGLQEIECALYMMEHNPLTELSISRSRSGEIVLSGKAELLGESCDFELVVERVGESRP